MFTLVFITGRNEIVAKVMFLQVCVCPQGGEGVCLSACWDAGPPPDQVDPPGPGRHPPGPGIHPPDQADPPVQADPTPLIRQTPPPGPGRPPPQSIQTPRWS